MLLLHMPIALSLFSCILFVVRLIDVFVSPTELDFDATYSTMLTKLTKEQMRRQWPNLHLPAVTRTTKNWLIMLNDCSYFNEC